MTPIERAVNTLRAAGLDDAANELAEMIEAAEAAETIEEAGADEAAADMIGRPGELPGVEEAVAGTSAAHIRAEAEAEVQVIEAEAAATIEVMNAAATIERKQQAAEAEAITEVIEAEAAAEAAPSSDHWYFRPLGGAR